MTTREGIKGAPTLKAAATGCSNAVCGVVEASEPSGKKACLTVNVGEAEPVKVMSPEAFDVDTRIVVALVGSSIGDVEVTQPTICTAAMLGWEGPGGTGPVTLPKAFSAGEPAPDEKPKAGGKAKAELDAMGNVVAVEALFVSKPKPTKEEKEIAKLEKAAAKGDAKATVKLQHLRLRQEIAAKRAAGEEVHTDDEMEKAGLEPP